MVDTDNWFYNPYYKANESRAVVIENGALSRKKQYLEFFALCKKGIWTKFSL